MATAIYCNQSYSLREFIARNQLPKNVCVQDGFYDDNDEGTLSAGQIITLHARKRTDKLRATLETKDAETRTFFIPLNCRDKVEIVPTTGREMYENISDLLLDRPPFVRVLHNIPWLHLKAGDILRPRDVVEADRTQFLLCEFYDQSRDCIKIPVAYGIAFKALADAGSYFLREVVEAFQLPVRVRFVESAKSVSELKVLGALLLEEQFQEETVIATSCFDNTVVVLNVLVDLDISVTPEPDPKSGDKSYPRFCNFMHDGAKLEKFRDWINQVRQEAPTVEKYEEYEEIGPPIPRRTSRSHDDPEERMHDESNARDTSQGSHLKPHPARPPKSPRFSQSSDVSRPEFLRQDADGQEDKAASQQEEGNFDKDEDEYLPWECSVPLKDSPLPPKRTTSLKSADADETCYESDEDYLLPVDSFLHVSEGSNVQGGSKDCSPGPTEDSLHEHFEVDDKKTNPSSAKTKFTKLFDGMKKKLSTLSLSAVEHSVTDAGSKKKNDNDDEDDDGGGGGDSDENCYINDENTGAGRDAAASHCDYVILPLPTSPKSHKPTKNLSVKEVGEWLRTLKMEQYMCVFEEALIDGDILSDLTEVELQDLGVERLVDLKRITKFIEGWRPNMGPK